MKGEITSSLNYYQIANADAESVKAGFLVRQYEYGVILDDLLCHKGEGSTQHYLILGKRGSGKSTLLRRLQIEIDTHQILKMDYVAINLAEEQAGIYRFFDLLEEVARELECRKIEIVLPDEIEPEAYTSGLLSAIHNALTRAGRKLVLLLDNVDRIFESMGEEATLLRAYLQNHQDIKIVGASTRMTEYFWAYDRPFYEFFRVLELRPLTRDEVKILLLDWGERLQTPKLKEFVENRPGQLETIRVLTDGLPRTLQFFVNILLTDHQATGYDYIRLIMDKVTPLYQERLNQLPASQRRIVLQMAFCWESVATKRLARETRMGNRLISAQLNQLIEKGVAEKIETRTKNHLYRLSERFFNLWLIFTQGGPREKQRAKYLTTFLENFYGAEELKEMAERYWQALKEGSIPADKAALLTKAYSQSVFIPYWLRDVLIEATRELSGIEQVLQHGLPPTTTEIMSEIFIRTRQGEWKKATELASAIEQEGGIKECFLGFILQAKGDLIKSEKSFLKSLKKGDEVAAAALVDLYFAMDKGGLAEKYAEMYLQKKGDSGLIAFTYYKYNKNKQKALSVLSSKDGLSDLDLSLVPVLKIWNGLFNDLEKEMHHLIQSQNAHLGFTLTGLLAHHQVGLLMNLFHDAEYGAKLFDKYYFIFLAAELMHRGISESFKTTPPEIRSSLHKYLISVFESRDFYYNTNELEQYLKEVGPLMSE